MIKTNPIQFFSWKLWEQIQQPQNKDPLYLRGYSHQSNRRSLPVKFVLWITDMVVATPLAMFFLPIVPLLLLLTHTLNGISLASTIAIAIAYEREHATLDILAVGPQGIIQVVWLIMTGSAHATHAYAHFNLWRRLVPRVIPMSIITFGMLIFMNVIHREITVLVTVINGSFFFIVVPTITVLLLNVDNIQTIVIASLAGILTASRFHHRHDARVVAVLVFLILQVLTYLVMYMIIVLPALEFARFTLGMSQIHWHLSIIFAPFYMIAAVTLITLTRELIAHVLWLALSHQLQA